MDNAQVRAAWPVERKGGSWLRLVSSFSALAAAFFWILFARQGRVTAESLARDANASPHRISTLGFDKQGTKRLSVDGTVKLVFADDSTSLARPPEIFIHCSEIFIDKGSTLFARLWTSVRTFSLVVRSILRMSAVHLGAILRSPGRFTRLPRA